MTSSRDTVRNIAMWVVVCFVGMAIVTGGVAIVSIPWALVVGGMAIFIVAAVAVLIHILNYVMKS